jgi:pimeloyl-ACP methyl ester carboxylesterase
LGAHDVGVADPRIDIDGYALDVECAGTGATTVVLESGALGGRHVWRRVFPELAGFARVCRYDRAGSGASNHSPFRRTFASHADELHALLTRLVVPPPRLLVGYSLGAAVVAEYARRHPGHVAGLVLVEPTPRAPRPPAVPRVTITCGARRAPLPPWVERPIVQVGADEAAWAFGRLHLVRGTLADIHVVAIDSGRNVPVDQPDVVVEAVRWLAAGVAGMPYPRDEPPRRGLPQPAPSDGAQGPRVDHTLEQRAQHGEQPSASRLPEEPEDDQHQRRTGDDHDREQQPEPGVQASTSLVASRDPRSPA